MWLNSSLVDEFFRTFSGHTHVNATDLRTMRFPSAHDPARNRHRCGVAWSKNAVRAILMNPRYTGYQVWNKQRKDEVLLDVEDVALGPTTTPPHSVGTRATSGSSQKRSHVVSWAGFL